MYNSKWGYSQNFIIFVFFPRGKLHPDETYTELIDVELNVGTVDKVKFLWNNNLINPTLPKLGAAKITVQDGEDGTVYVCIFF